MKCVNCGNSMRIAKQKTTAETEERLVWICDECHNTSTEGIGACDTCGRDCLDRQYESNKTVVPIRLVEGCTECVRCNICEQPLGSLTRINNTENANVEVSEWSHTSCIAKQNAAKRVATYSPEPTSTTYPDIGASSILTLGILSLLCLGFVLGPLAWTRANSALKQIEQGYGNPHEAAIVATGQNLGVIGTVIGVSEIVAWIFHSL